MQKKEKMMRFLVNYIINNYIKQVKALLLKGGRREKVEEEKAMLY